MRVALLHPAAHRRPCDECVRFLHFDEPGKFGDAVTRGGKKVRRLPTVPPPCYYCPKQPDDVPEADRCPATAVELSDRNWRAWLFHRECQAVGRFPADPIVRRNAALIAAAEKLADQVAHLNALLLTRTGV